MCISKLDNYLKSSEWQEIVSYSNLLYKAANISLDLIIQELGLAYYKVMKEYEYLISFAKIIYKNRTIFPYSTTRMKQYNKPEKYCYIKDVGY